MKLSLKNLGQMLASINIGHLTFQVNLAEGLDISIPFVPGAGGPNCFFAPLFEASPLKASDWIGDTRLGSPVNFFNVRINPHGNGTHTECVGHISTEHIYIKDVAPAGLQLTQLISVIPEFQHNGDKIINHKVLADLDILSGVNTLVIRTMPNHIDKLQQSYSGTNPTYFDHKLIEHWVNIGIEHLIVDVPSIDREEDDGLLLGHKAFWQYPEKIDTKKTITEMVFVHNSIQDGIYLCQIGVVPFALDAAPSRIVLYKIL